MSFVTACSKLSLLWQNISDKLETWDTFKMINEQFNAQYCAIDLCTRVPSLNMYNIINFESAIVQNTQSLYFIRFPTIVYYPFELCAKMANRYNNNDRKCSKIANQYHDFAVQEMTEIILNGFFYYLYFKFSEVARLHSFPIASE